jgi:hypothetical protein
MVETKLKIEEIAVERLAIFDKNARTHSTKQVAKIATSIDDRGSRVRRAHQGQWPA